MDPTDKSIISFPFDFPPTSDSQPSPSVPFASVDNSVNFPFDWFPQVQSDFTTVAKAENGRAETDHVAVPRPLECLQGNPIPPFLTKTYDVVEDPSLDPIISWGERGDSFVVWEPADFATIVLPRNFKHADFFSFVRQLNTYVRINSAACSANSILAAVALCTESAQVGSFSLLKGFRKIDANKWEFANGFFLRGSKHLLKKIRRRRSPQQVASEATGPMMETELEKLRMDKSVIMQEMVELQHQHHETAERMETIKRRLQVSELRQKSMVSLVAKAVQNPELIEEAMEMERLLSCSARTRRKIVKQESQEQGCQQSASMDEQIILNLESPEMLNSLPQHYLLQESMLFQTDNVSNELVASQDVMGTPLQTGGCGASTPANRDFSSLEIGYFVDYPEDLATGMVFSEFPVPVKEETLSYVSSSTVDSWSTVADCNYPVAGNCFSGGLSANWNLCAIQETGNCEIEKWKTDESTVGGCGSKDV